MTAVSVHRSRLEQHHHFDLAEPVELVTIGGDTVALVRVYVSWARQMDDDAPWSWSLVASDDRRGATLFAGSRFGVNDDPRLATTFADLLEQTNPLRGLPAAIAAAQLTLPVDRAAAGRLKLTGIRSADYVVPGYTAQVLHPGDFRTPADRG